VVTQPNSPIIAVFVKYSEDEPIGYYFDSPVAPEYRQILGYSVPFDTIETEAVISYDDGSYLVFYDDNKVGGHCIISDGDSGVSDDNILSIYKVLLIMP